jgi:hypothetical protein
MLAMDNKIPLEPVCCMKGCVNELRGNSIFSNCILVNHNWALCGVTIFLTIWIFFFMNNTAFAQNSFHTDLVGEAEVPPIFSASNGTVLMVGNSTNLRYQINVTALEGITAARLYLGENTENGEVVLTLFNSAEPTGLVSGMLTEGNISPSNFQGPLTDKNLSSLIESINQNLIYVNVHTSQYPSGELRGTLRANLPPSSTSQNESVNIPSSSDFTDAQSDNFKNYTNKEMKYSIQYPSNWKVEEHNYMLQEVSFSALDREFGASLDITVRKVQPYLDTDTMTLKNTTLQQFVQQKLDVPYYSDLIRQNETTVGGEPAWKIEYNGPAFYHFDIDTIFNGKVYTLSYGDEPLKVPESLPIVNKMVKSFQFRKE